MDFKYIIHMLRRLVNAENTEWGDEAITELLNEIYSRGHADGIDSTDL